MTLQQLLEYAVTHGISLDTEIALRAKDDFLLTADKVSLKQAYFGNCRDGSRWEREHGPRDANDDPDYENMPKMLILDTGRY